MNNKKAWIRIIESFVAILLIVGVLLAFVSEFEFDSSASERFYQEERSILKQIQFNEILRDDILNAEISSQIDWVDFDVSLGSVKNKINEVKPNYLECEAVLCDIEQDCIYENNINKDIYSQSVFLSANLDNYAPRELKLFCWVK